MATKSFANTPPKTAISRALCYLNNQWPRLIVYLDDGALAIDNNLRGNAVRPFVIGRKNWLFSSSQAGAKASANLYSLIETDKANDLEPYNYLMQVLTQLPQAESVDTIEALCREMWRCSWFDDYDVVLVILLLLKIDGKTFP